MTSCRECRDRLSPYLEGELEGKEFARLEEHLDECAACRAELELFRLTVDTLRGLPDLPAPAGILKGVREGMAPLPWHRRLVRALAGPGWRRLPLGTFATLLVAFGIFMLTERYSEIGQPPRVAPPTVAPVVEPALPPTDETRAEAEKDDVFPAEPERSTSVTFTMEDKAASRVDGDTIPEGNREMFEAAEVPAEGLATLPRQDAPAVTLQGKGETIAGPSFRAEQRLAKAPLEVRATGQVGTAVPPEVGKRLAFTAGSKKEISRDLGVLDTVKRKKAAPARSPSPSTLAKGTTQKSIPYTTEGEAAAGVASFADDRAGPRGMTMAEEAIGRTDDTEIFTIVSFTEDEMGELRRSLKEAGGHLLEMKTIDAYASQQVALPYQNRIPASQMISRGWQIRATVPRDNMERFVDSLNDRQALQLLHRAQAPADWDAEPGSQKIEINLIR